MSGVECNYFEVNPSRSVSGSNFSQGILEYPFTVGVPNTWVASKSYFRVSMSVYGVPAAGPAAAAPTESQMVAFADNAVANLFDNCYLRSNNVSISSIIQGFPQAAALKERIGEAFGFLKSVGNGAQMSEAKFPKRVMNVSASTIPNSNLGSFDEMYKPVVAGHFANATVSTVLNSYVVNGLNTLFTTGMPSQTGANVGGPVLSGDIIVIEGARFTVLSVVNDLQLLLSSATDVIGATPDWYIIRRDTIRAPQAQNTVFATFQPPLGIFNYHGPLSGGEYRLVLNPSANYLLNGVETRNPNFSPSADGLSGTYSLVVNECKFYAYIEKMRIPDSVQDLNLNEYLVQSKTWLPSLQFTVPPSTYAITIFVQDAIAGRSPLVPPSMFKMADNSDLKLQTIQVSYAGIVKPSTAWLSNFSTDYVNGGVNQLEQRYRDTYAESGMDVHSDGVETYHDYLLRGPIYHFTFLRDMSNRATELTVNTQFNGLPSGPPNGIVYCVAWYSKIVQITHAAGMLVNVAARQV
jgi:hypothetical protein